MSANLDELVGQMSIMDCYTWFKENNLPLPTPSGCFDYEDFADVADDLSWWHECVLDSLEGLALPAEKGAG